MQTKFSIFSAQTGREGLPPRGILPLWTGAVLQQGRLLHGPLPPGAGGGLLGITAVHGPFDPVRTGRELANFCRRWGLTGLLWDLPAGSSPAPALALSRMLPPAAVPLTWADALPKAKVLVPAALSGGSFAEMLEAAGRRFGRSRCWLDLGRFAARFSMPAQDPTGSPLSPEQLEALLTQTPGWFCPTLCCNCRTESGAFVLYDDPDSARRKLELARQAGFSGAVIRRSEWGATLLQ